MEERRRAIEVVEFIAGAIEEMEPGTIKLLERFRDALGLPGLVLRAPSQDPLKLSATAKPDDLANVMTEVATAVEAREPEGAALEAVKGELGAAKPKTKAKQVA